jgi:conjugal transfer pilus assembly protein TraF
MSNREDVDLSTSGNVDSTTGEHVDTSTGGDPFYCGERKLGTWFYCERPKAKPSEQSASASAASPTYRQQLDKIGARLEELKAKAILEPTSDNIVAYVRYQREQLDRASTLPMSGNAPSGSTPTSTTRSSARSARWANSLARPAQD